MRRTLLCGLCNEQVEENSHLFCTCKESWKVWMMVLKWWGLQGVLPNTVKGMAEVFMYGLGRNIGREVGSYIFCWYLGTFGIGEIELFFKMTREMTNNAS
ncbi:hypothetical protein SLA2020_076900 [Shorea laevis]